MLLYSLSSQFWTLLQVPVGGGVPPSATLPVTCEAACESLSSKACRDYSNVQNGSLVCPNVHPPVSEMHLRLGGCGLRVDPVAKGSDTYQQMNKLQLCGAKVISSTKRTWSNTCPHETRPFFRVQIGTPPIHLFNGSPLPFQGGGAGGLAGSQPRSEESWVP